MRVVTAPSQGAYESPSLFLAGGITGCPSWQDDFIGLLTQADMTLLNPRRDPWPDDPDEVERQIRWEWQKLREATAISFWFPCETICPIALFELGAWSKAGKQIFVGVHPEYQRRQDVEIQMRLARPSLEVVYSLEDLAKQVKRDWLNV